jgi:hypothetical protein
MPLVVERSFETAGNIVTGAVSRGRHRLSRSQAPAPRTANEEVLQGEVHDDDISYAIMRSRSNSYWAPVPRARVQ